MRGNQCALDGCYDGGVHYRGFCSPTCWGKSLERELDETMGKLAELEADLDQLKDLADSSSLPDDLRAQGWAVAAHNDYRQLGEPHTFWLLTRGCECVKGEGHTDADALNNIRALIRGSMESTEGILAALVHRPVAVGELSARGHGPIPDPEETKHGDER